MDKITDRHDWILKTAEAAKKLIASHGYSADDFHVCDKADEISLDWGEDYPASFRDVFRGKPRDWVSHKSMIGVTLYWPNGIDHNGEGFDPQDPIYLLSQHEWVDSDEFEEWFKKEMEAVQ
jgi:hypothetical protein